MHAWMLPAGAGHARRRGYGMASIALLLCFFFSALLFCTSMLTASTVMPDTAEDRCEGALQPVDQVVLLLVDAMRPDFVLSALRRYSRSGGGCVPHQTSPEPTRAGTSGVGYYSGPTLRYMENALQDPTDASLGFILVADAPTTTAQRLKAIATGTMPGFLEAGSNFNSDATPLDSFVRQAGGRAVLLGDDTWTKLFPGRAHWKRMVPIPSFDVADFHSNDDAVLGEIYSVLAGETAEATQGGEPYAKLIVAHFLGIDHVGHRINAANREMDGKLLQLNAMLMNVSATLRSRRTAMNTMLLVLGDHGMTQSGDHGGDSPLETDTFLFAQLFRGSEQLPPNHRRGAGLSAVTAISPGSAARTREMAQARQAERADPALVRLDSCIPAARVAEARLGAAYQVDVTPTVSLLLGHPIPFSNFGRVLPEVLALADATADLDAADRCNERQMLRYFAASGMAVPADAPWRSTTLHSTRQRIAAMSFYARRTRTDMHMPGMIAGSLALVACALSALAMRDVQDVFLRPSASVLVGLCVVVLRWGITFANSFIVYEDVSVFGLFAFSLLCTYVARVVGAAAGRSSCALRVAFVTAPAARNAIVLLAVTRALLPYALRRRFHITHAVDSESLLDIYLAPLAAGPLGPLLSRVGLVLGCALWTMGSVCMRPCERPPAVAQRMWRLESPKLLSAPALALATAVAMGGSHGVPVAHHVVPVLLILVHCVVSRRLARRSVMGAVSTRGYAYIVWALWSASLCNEQCAVSVMIAAYGALLPAFVRALRAAEVPTAVQALLLHLLSWAVFFLQGHQCMLSTIDWNASFVGMRGYSMAMGGVLVLTRTFNAFLLPPVACTVAAEPEGGRVSLTNASRRATDEKENGAEGSTESPLFLQYLLLAMNVVQATLSALSAFLQKNHLMLVPIFCPKLIFDVVICLMTGVGVALSLL